MTSQINYYSPCELEVVQYPGKVINIDKAVGSLGGLLAISQAFGCEQKRLELCFHPKNPFNKGISGEMSKNSGLLISVKVRQSKKRPTQLPTYKISVLGHCNRNFTFNNLCDFQFLPICREPGGVLETFTPSSFIPESAIDTKYFSQINVPLISVPQVFARTDAAHTGIFRSEPQDDGQHDVLGIIQKTSYESRDVIPFSMTDVFPMQPDIQLLKRMKIKYISDEQLQKIKQLFEECPVWTRIALLYESGITNEKLKCIIPSLAYYFSTGPWRTLYVRFGYDPRKDFKSRFYQTFDFRLRFRSGMSEFVANRKDQLKKLNDNNEELSKLVQDVNYPYFEENKLPRSRQCILRYCDIHMRKIQEMIDKIPSPRTGATCNEKTGWLPIGFDTQVRLVMSNAVKDLLRSHYRKGQVHAELDSMDNIEEADTDATFDQTLSENIELQESDID